MTETGFLEANEAFTRLAGPTGGPEAARRLAKRLHDALTADGTMSSALRRADVVRSGEIDLTRADGSRVTVVVTVLRTSVAPLRFTGFIVDLSDRVCREERMRESMGEMRHRSKNILAIVRSLARQLARTSPDLATFEQRFSDRLQALGAAQEVLVRQDWAPASLHEVVATQIAHVVEDIGTRVRLLGPDIRIDARAARAVGMAIHELATNAMKYGALSSHGGRVEIGWSRAMDSERPVTILWREVGGPSVERPSRRGFGQMVVETMVARAFGAKVRYDFLPDGVEWEVSLPADCVKARTEPCQPSAKLPACRPGRNSSGSAITSDATALLADAEV